MSVWAKKGDSQKAPGSTGGELGMQEPYGEGVANHADLESCAGAGDIAGEALTEALAGRLGSCEIPSFGCRPCGLKGKATSIVASSQAACEPGAVARIRARQESLGTSGNSPHENREQI